MCGLPRGSRLWRHPASPRRGRDGPADSVGRDELAEPFNDHRHALPATDAHRLETESLVVVLQRVDERRRDAGAGHAERVTHRDRPAVDVELVTERVDTQ